MKSREIQINKRNSLECADKILTEAEKFASYHNLSTKDSLHLRLLSEELIGMTNSILDVSDGTFWIEENNGTYELKIIAHAEIGDKAKELLLSSSSDGKNQYSKGITGRICQVLDWLGSAQIDPVMMSSTNYPMGMLPAMPANSLFSGASGEVHEWSLNEYRKAAKKDAETGNWDELEKSILIKLADDVLVGVRSGKVAMTIIKKFDE